MGAGTNALSARRQEGFGSVRAGMAMANEIIDFKLERGRHGVLLGREDVLAEVEALLAGASRGPNVRKCGPGS